jgi:hypothetical protein
MRWAGNVARVVEKRMHIDEVVRRETTRKTKTQVEENIKMDLR